jgi:hypothetical protein
MGLEDARCRAAPPASHGPARSRSDSPTHRAQSRRVVQAIQRTARRKTLSPAQPTHSHLVVASRLVRATTPRTSRSPASSRNHPASRPCRRSTQSA